MHLLACRKPKLKSKDFGVRANIGFFTHAVCAFFYVLLLSFCESAIVEKSNLCFGLWCSIITRALSLSTLPIASSLFFFPPLLSRGTNVGVTEQGLFFCLFFPHVFPVWKQFGLQYQIAVRWGLYDSCAEASSLGFLAFCRETSQVWQFPGLLWNAFL